MTEACGPAGLASCCASGSHSFANLDNDQGHKERETRGRLESPLAPWIFLVVRLVFRPQGPCYLPARWGHRGRYRQQGWALGKEGTLIRMEAVEEGMALQEGEVAGFQQDLQPLVEDIMQEVELVTVEEEQELMSS